MLSLWTTNELLEYAGSSRMSFPPTDHIVPNIVCCGCAINRINFSVASMVGSTCTHYKKSWMSIKYRNYFVSQHIETLKAERSNGVTLEIWILQGKLKLFNFYVGYVVFIRTKFEFFLGKMICTLYITWSECVLMIR